MDAKPLALILFTFAAFIELDGVSANDKEASSLIQMSPPFTVAASGSTTPFITGTYKYTMQPPVNVTVLLNATAAEETDDDFAHHTVVTTLPTTNGRSRDTPANKQPGISINSMGRQRLLQHLTNPMNKQQNSDQLPTHVRVKLIPIKIQDLNEKNEVLETTIRLQVSWYDNRLAWEPSLYSNVTELIIPGDAIWSPDVGILNSVSDIYHVVRDTRFEMKVESTGRIWWHPTGIVKTYCKLHLRYFPFDRQKCKLVLESPTLDIRFMNLTLRSITEPVDTIMYISGETWDLLGVTGFNVINKLSLKTTFARVEFEIYIQRARIYHLLNVIFPAVFLSLVQVMFFLLPATHPQRVGSSTTTLLSVVVFHSIASSQLPKTSTDVPILAFYIFIVTFISGLSVCTSIFVAKFAVYAEQNHKMPNWLKRIRRPKMLRRKSIGRTAQIPHEMNTMDVIVHMDDTLTNEGEMELFTPNTKVQPLPPIDHGEIFRTWNDVSNWLDLFLLLVSASMALLAPVILFVLIPWLVDQS